MSELPHILQRSRQSVLYRHGQHFRKNATSKKRNDSVVSLNRSAKKTASTCRWVGTSLQKELRTRKNREARRSNHKWLDTTITVPQNPLCGANHSHGRRRFMGTWIESQTRLPQHKRRPNKGAIWHRTRRGHNYMHPSTITLRWADNHPVKKAPIPQKKKSVCIHIIFIYISKMLYRVAKAQLILFG